MSRGMRRLIWIGASFILVSTTTRVGLALFSGNAFALHEWARFMAIGLLFDLVVLPCFLMPWALYDALMPEWGKRHRLHRWENRWATLWASFFLALFAIVAASEFTFWAEFGSRFDFIAVDYLIYTKEVIGNILESYPVELWIAMILVACFAAVWFTWPAGGRSQRTSWLTRWGRAAAVAIAIALGTGLVSKGIADNKANAHVAELSNNGIFAFAHAFRNNALDYDKYYPGFKADELNSEIRSLVREANAAFTSATGIERKITAQSPRKNLNVILISVESLSAEYMGKFGGTLGITPELDKLADKGLFFTKLYSTGTRTVRGLEALSVGTPPTPGQSIVRRPDSGGLVTLGAELQDKGWKPYWIYGGYGVFDNMNAYFKSNGYTIVDRVDVAAEKIPIHAENIWGIADEDLYSLAMANLDREYAKGQRFFAQIMTTSNHRPYTFPENRIDLPQKKRESGVKYTDWAIGDFIRRSAKKPWFDKTLFIIVSDHTSKAAGKTDLPPARYHIPMIWYAPGLIKPAVMGRLMSQIDIGPTLMAWLGLSYSSRFFGYDMFRLEAGRERAFISTYQKLGYLKGDRLAVLDVNKPAIVVDGLKLKTAGSPSLAGAQMVKEAIAWYQSASFYYRTGQLKAAAKTKDR